MATFVISKRFDDRYRFSFTSRKGKIIFTSTSYELKMECEDLIELLKHNIDNLVFTKTKNTSGKHFFKIHFQDGLIGTSRKYTTVLLLERGINDIKRSLQQSEILDFTNSESIFLD